MQKLASLFLVFGLAFSVIAAEKFKVVLHMDSNEPGHYEKVLGHIDNLLVDSRLKGETDIVLMANSRGAYLLVQNSEYEERLKKLADKGVTLKICQNSMKKYKIDPLKVYPFAKQVESAMGELTLLQHDGYAYIHPSVPERNP